MNYYVIDGSLVESTGKHIGQGVIPLSESEYIIGRLMILRERTADQIEGIARRMELLLGDKEIK